jgi:hypothetical protein
MTSTCAGIDKYTFYLGFKGVLSSTPKVTVAKLEKKENSRCIMLLDLLKKKYVI